MSLCENIGDCSLGLSARSTNGPAQTDGDAAQQLERGSMVRYTACPNPMMRLRCASCCRAQPAASPCAAISSSRIERAIRSYHHAAVPKRRRWHHRSRRTRRRGGATTRAVNVEALKP